MLDDMKQFILKNRRLFITELGFYIAGVLALVDLRVSVLALAIAICFSIYNKK